MVVRCLLFTNKQIMQRREEKAERHLATRANSKAREQASTMPLIREENVPQKCYGK